MRKRLYVLSVFRLRLIQSDVEHSVTDGRSPPSVRYIDVHLESLSFIHSPKEEEEEVEGFPAIGRPTAINKTSPDCPVTFS